VDMAPTNDIAKKLVFCGNRANVYTTIIDGKVVMENHHMIAFDEQALIDKAQICARDLVERSGIRSLLQRRGGQSWPIG
jgi:hypothetical protein